jgi:predicted metal-binding membrane protein
MCARASSVLISSVAAGTLEHVLRRDRLIVAIALAALTVGSWMWMLLPDPEVAGSAGARLMPCCGASFLAVFAMWVVMMAAMMIPSAAPMVLAHAGIVRRRVALGSPYIPSSLFLAGYLVAWSAFSAVAAVAHWLLYQLSFLDHHTLSISPWAGAAVLLAAGLFQLTPAKDACLSKCRAPIGYFLTEWRDGNTGAIAMGLRHGRFCIGCCSLLMAVLFSVGVMNVLWGVVITAFVAVEKIVPWKRAVVWSGAAACLASAAALAYRALDIQ